MVFSYLHFQVGTWKVIVKRLHAVSTFVLWNLRLDNADAGETSQKTGVLSNLFSIIPTRSFSWRKSTAS